MILDEKRPEQEREKPPLLSWEDVENAEAGQLNLPGLSPMPTLAERAFLALARDWVAKYEEQGDPKRMTTEMSDIELACLLLSIEWGWEFTAVATRQAEINQGIAARHCECSWHLDLVWRLCAVARRQNPEKSAAVDELLVNLNHEKSDIRIWMMRLAWMVRPWLPKSEVIERLLDNLANTLAGTGIALGLARAFCESDEELDSHINVFRTDPDFAEQFASRLAKAKEVGYMVFESRLSRREAIYRKQIEKAILGCRYAPPACRRQEVPLVPEKKMDFLTMPLDGNRPFLEQFEERAAKDADCRAWLDTQVYTNIDLMKDHDPVSVAIAKGLARSKS